MQDKLWYYIENFYHEQGREHSGYVTESYLSALARQVPHLNLTLWGEDRHDPLLAAQVTDDEYAARAARVYSTPSFLIGRTGSPALFTLDQFATLDAVSDAVQQVLHHKSDHGRRTPPTSASAGSARPLQSADAHRSA